jgi:hypothetical protein
MSETEKDYDLQQDRFIGKNSISGIKKTLPRKGKCSGFRKRWSESRRN